MSILIIDDSDEARDLLQTILQGVGFGPLISVATAQEGLLLLGIGKRGIQSSDIDLVLMDLEMPGVDGLEACRQIRGEDDLQGLPIIVITAPRSQATSNPPIPPAPPTISANPLSQLN